MTEIDVTAFGFRLPTPVAESSSDDAKFDKAIETLRKKAVSQAKKPTWEPPKVPARLAKPKDGDLERIMDLLPPEVFDSGVYTYDLTRTGDDRKEYLAAWRYTTSVREPHEGLVAALVGLALALEGGAAAVAERLPIAAQHPYLVVKLVSTFGTLPELPPREVLTPLLEALAVDGEPRDMYMCWYSAARVAVRLGPEVAAERLVPHLGTDRAKAVRDALLKEATVDPSWRDTLLPLVAQNVEVVVQLAARLPPDEQVAEALLARLKADHEASGFVLPTHPALPYLAANATDELLEGSTVAELVRSARG